LIVLDTHALLWLALAPERLSATAAETIAADTDRGISMITVQEIAYLVARGRVALFRPTKIWIGDALSAFQVRTLPITVAASLRAGSLDPEEFHGDPIDRLIYATAVENDAQLITADGRLRRSDPARTVW
jgi:PIN domain nuclease of toxin-antitoxin system